MWRDIQRMNIQMSTLLLDVHTCITRVYVTLLLDVHTCITRVYVSVNIQMSTLLLDVHAYITLVYVSVNIQKEAKNNTLIVQ